MRKAIDITKEELVQMYCYDNMSDADIAPKYNVTPNAICYYRKKWGIKKLYRNKEWIDEKYNGQHLSLVDIAKLINCTEDTIGLAMRKFGLEIKRDRRGNAIKHNVNENIFHIIDTPEKAYWLGYITADGCISDDKKRRKSGYTYHYHRLTFCISKKDRYILESFRYFISGEDIKIQDNTVHAFGKEYEQSSMKVSSKTITDDLMKHGIMPRKSGNEKPPIGLPDYLVRHFIRGEFDGDGSVSISSKNLLRITIVGSKNLMEWIKQQFGYGSIRKDLKSPMLYEFQLYEQSEVLRFYKWLYDGATMYLPRKKAVFDSVFSNNQK